MSLKGVKGCPIPLDKGHPRDVPIGGTAQGNPQVVPYISWTVGDVSNHPRVPQMQDTYAKCSYGTLNFPYQSLSLTKTNKTPTSSTDKFAHVCKEL